MKMKISDIIRIGTDKTIAQIIGGVIAMRTKEFTVKEAMKLDYSQTLEMLRSEMEIDYKQTNADRIRSMSNEELAAFLLSVNCASEYCMPGKKDCKWEDYPKHTKGCKNCFMVWLKSEVEE